MFASLTFCSGKGTISLAISGKSRRKSMLKFIGRQMTILCTAAALCLATAVTAYAGINNTQNNPEVFVDGTKVNGVGVAGMTPSEAKERIESFYQGSYSLTLTDREGNKDTIRDVDIQLKVTVGEGLDEILTRENESGRISGPAIDNSYDIPMEIQYNEEAFQQKLQSLTCVTRSDIIKTQNARISDYSEETGFTILPEVQGNDVNMESLAAAVKDALANHRSDLNLDEAGCYNQVQIYSTDEGLKNQCEAMNQRASMTISYLFGDAKEVLDGKTIVSWLTWVPETGITVDQNQVAAYIKTLADKYDTAVKPHLFRTATGQDVTVTGPYGWKIDQAAEIQALTAAILNGQSLEKEPAYSQTAASRSGNDYGMTYVEVDLGNQHMYLVENGQCILDSPFVSGNVSKDWTTPPGIFGLYYKQKDKVLRGEDYATPVKYWMPFNGGIGLHDADWRSSFGGEIYKTNGSHGCINLPPAKAAVLYEHVYKNMPIICHN